MIEYTLFSNIEAFFANQKDVEPTKLLISEAGISVYEEGRSLAIGEKLVLFSKKDFSSQISLLEERVSNVKKYSAEEWLNEQGYSSIRLITLLDLENKLNALNKESEKLSTVRSWIDSILGAFVQNPAPKSDWIPAPYSFEETTQEAFSALTA